MSSRSSRLARRTPALIGAALLLAGALALVCGGLPAPVALSAWERVWPVLLFVAAITVVVRLADDCGVFGAVAAVAVRLASGRVIVLWLLIAATTTLSTVFLSIDTAVVLLTPIVMKVTKRVGLPPLPFALTVLWLANTASQLLPVSNLTNLLAMQRLQDAGPLAFAARMWPAEIAGIVVPLIAVWLLFRRDLRDSFTVASPTGSPAVSPAGSSAPTAARRGTGFAGIVLLAMLAGLLCPVPAWVPAVGAMAVLLAGARWYGDVRGLPAIVGLVPWGTVVFVSGLLLGAAMLGPLGLDRVLYPLIPGGSGLPALLATAGVGALFANAINNLPAYLLLEPLLHGPWGFAAVLIGVNSGPLVTAWGSLATLLWADGLRLAGMRVNWGRFALQGAVVAAATMLLSVLGIWALSLAG